jgi:hypothetical protein
MITEYISPQFNPFMELLGMRDGQDHSPCLICFTPIGQESFCGFCGRSLHHLYMISFNVGLCNTCFYFALNCNFPKNEEPKEFKAAA